MSSPSPVPSGSTGTVPPAASGGVPSPLPGTSPERYDRFEFETFQRGIRHEPSLPMVTLTRGKTLTLNRRAYEVLGKSPAVELLYDQKRGIIALRPVPQDDANGYSIQRQDDSRVHVVSVGAFVNYYGIDISETRRYQADLYNGLLIIDTQRPVSVVRGSRGRQSASISSPTPSRGSAIPRSTTPLTNTTTSPTTRSGTGSGTGATAGRSRNRS